MRIEMITVGNELLNGDLADTNTKTVGAFLRRRGLSLHGGRTIADEFPAMQKAFEAASESADLVLVSGGLGPTTDDMTVQALARFAGVELESDARVLAAIKARFTLRGYPFTENNAKQALVPEGANALENLQGTAPGIRLHHAESDTTFFLFPGVPRELVHLADTHLGPWLDRNAASRPYHSAIFKTFGKTESQVAELLDTMDVDSRVHIAYRASFPEIGVSVHVWDADDVAAAALLAQHAEAVRERLGDIVYTEDPAETYAAAIGRELRDAGATVAPAESCTGGLISKMLTDVSGSSAWLVEGIVTYSNASKVRRLGVSETTLDAHGAVSEAVAREMAEGVRRTSGATYGTSVTGIAGPTGGTDEKPVGTVHFAVSGPQGTWHRHRRLPFGRERNRVVSAYVLLDMLRRYPEGIS